MCKRERKKQQTNVSMASGHDACRTCRHGSAGKTHLADASGKDGAVDAEAQAVNVAGLWDGHDGLEAAQLLKDVPQANEAVRGAWAGRGEGEGGRLASDRV